MPCYRTCGFKPKQNTDGMKEARKLWEIWDLRILTLYILIAQLYLHFFGRRRRKSNKSAPMMNVSVWFIYLFSELLATLALGKLSKLKVNKNDSPDSTDNSNVTLANSTNTTGNVTTFLGEEALRVMWAPLILFYLGGPDTITVLRVEENQLWMRHLIGLLTQGLRAAYALIATWSMKTGVWSLKGGVSLLAVLVFITGIIKYGERVWVVRSRSKEYKDFVQLDLRVNKVSNSRPYAKLVLLAYFWIQTLMPHNPYSKCDGSRVEFAVTKFREFDKAGNRFEAFELIEIELGLMYDMLFTKVGTIFTLWGSVLRFLSFSLIVSVLVIYLTGDKPTLLLGGDDEITIILLAGAIFLEIGGIVVQLVSDWAVVWACKNQTMLAAPVLYLHEKLGANRQRWSGVMGQFSFRDFCANYKQNRSNNARKNLFGMEKMLKRFSSQKNPVSHLNVLIIEHLREKSEPEKKVTPIDNTQTPTEKTAGSEIVEPSDQQDSPEKVANDDDDKLPTSAGSDIVEQTHQQASPEKIAYEDKLPTSAVSDIVEQTHQQASPEKIANEDKLPASGVTRGEWTLERHNLAQELEQINKLEFGRRIVVWHVATEVFYASEHGRDYVKLKAVKMLSDYMMYLLVACPSRLPFCNKYDIMNDYDKVKDLFNGGGLLSSREKGARNNEGDDTTTIALVNKVVQAMEAKSNKWDIMGSIWAEMLCYAADKCSVKNHLQELRHGGEFLTHIWLLLMHFGITRKQVERLKSRKDELGSGAKTCCLSFREIGDDSVQNALGNNSERTHKNTCDCCFWES